MRLRKIPARFLSTEIDGEVVMISADTGAFFALKDIGREIWAALDDQDDLDSICKALQAEYEVDPSMCRTEVAAFASQLVDAGFAEYI